MAVTTEPAMPDQRCQSFADSASCFVTTAQDKAMAAIMAFFAAVLAFPWGTLDGWTKIGVFIGMIFGVLYAFRRWRNERLQGELIQMRKEREALEKRRLELELAEREGVPPTL